jgi:hypothetical protein
MQDGVGYVKGERTTGSLIHTLGEVARRGAVTTEMRENAIEIDGRWACFGSRPR